MEMKKWLEDIIKNIYWAEKEIKLLKKCLESDMTYKQCAEKLERSPQSIKAKAIELGFSVPKTWSKQEKTLLKSYIKSGLMHSECATKLGRSLGSVQQMAYLLRHPEKKSKKSKKRLSQRFGSDTVEEKVLKMSEEEKKQACLNCTLPECINCFGAEREGK